MTPDLPHVIQLVDVIIQAANEGKQQHHLDNYPVDCQHLRSLPCNLLSNVMDLFQAVAELLHLFKMSVLLCSLGLDWPHLVIILRFGRPRETSGMTQLRSCRTVLETKVRTGVDLRSIGPILCVAIVRLAVQ